MESTSTAPSSVDDITWHIYVGTISTIVPATLVVILRLAARHVSRAGLWWDDHTIVVALILNWAMAALRWAQILLHYYGADSHSLPPEKVQGFGKLFIAVQLIYFLNAVFTKASLLLLYHRIFGVVQGFRWVLWISGFIVIAYWLANTLVTIFQCWPISKLWNPNYEGHCINIGAFGRWSGVANVIIDIVILCLPYPMAWRLQTTLRQKMILTGIFLLGTFVCIISILRVTSFDYRNLGDGTYKNIEPATWSSIEQSVGIICACLPTLRPFFRWLYGASRKSTKNRDSGMSEFPKQPLACRTSQAGTAVDEENALGLADLPAADEREAWKEVRRSQVQVGLGNERPLSQETVGSHLSRDFRTGRIGILEPRPSSFA
ncbi:hypothetical protein N7456_000430 [Penicillium angulare]|uniref:Rhodopsin domain-containing protein n=1 Tax=Penicillium angulare TaxID=116970 RepID=A0A9W9GC46_9EURO|nr:hypothetical protein N7456_000430 [Penicillium angulare]